MSGSTNAQTSEANFDAGTVTAFQPLPPSPTHSVNPDHSSFGMATSHAENRTKDPTYGRRPDWRDRVLFSACGQEIFVGDFNDVTSVATATRECRRNGNNQYALPHQLVSSHSCSTTCCTSASTHHPGFYSPANATCSYYHNVSDTPTHADTASHPVPTRLCLYFPYHDGSDRTAPK